MRYPKYRNTLNRHKWCTQEIENISSQVNIQMQFFVRHPKLSKNDIL